MSDRDPFATISDPVLRTAAVAVRLYAETHPRPTQVTQLQAAEMLGVSPRTVYNLIRAGKLRLTNTGSIAIGDVDVMLASQELRSRSR